MNIKVEMVCDDKLKLEVDVHRYPDGRVKSVMVCSENYKGWIDENSDLTWVRKDTKFDDLISEPRDGHRKALREQLESESS